jgi:tRNA (guanine10-N2)-dimethyltransferase
VQDINAYARRDQNRPKRDARVGMLPPKLAQTIVNLATGPIDPKYGAVVLDPFCGTGVVLQEAALMGFDIYGTDIEPRMIEYTDQNLAWLQDHLAQHITVHGQDKRYYRLEVGDATEHAWTPPPSIVASETYLGRPLSSWPNADTLREIIGTCNVIIEKFLRNLAEQTQPGLRLCLAVPAWHAPNGKIHHLPLIDHLEKIGYNRYRFEHVRDADLVYYRPGQIVGRELLVITRK